MAEPFKLAFTDARDLEAQIEEYFQSLHKTRTIRQTNRQGEVIEFEEEYQLPPTLAGMADYLGVTHQTLRNYGNGKHDTVSFAPIIARAKNRLAKFAEEALYTREAATGAQFALRVNHGYGADQQEGGGSGFEQKIIPPAAHDAAKAIPKWTDEED